MSSHQPPAHLRYLKARLRPLLRPQVWGTIIFLFVVSTLAGFYFANLEEFIAEENQDTPTLSNNNNAENDETPQSSISAEDRAIAADIDISTVLENDLAANTETLDAAPEKPRENIFEQYMRQRQTKDKAANSSEGQANQQPAANLDDNPFTIRFPTGNNAGRNNAATSTNPFLSNLSNNNSNAINLPNNTTSNLNNTNALQSALDRANGYNRQANLDANGNAINPLQAALDRYATSNNLNQNTITNNANRNFPIGQQQLNPLLGTTPYNPGLSTTTPTQGTVPLSPYTNVPGYTTLPGQVNTVPTNNSVIPNSVINNYNPGLTTNPPNSYTYLNQPVTPTTTQINPSISPTVPGTTINNPAVPVIPNQVQNSPQPFSVPNNIPGRNIGGGQINTFSNP